MNSRWIDLSALVVEDDNVQSRLVTTLLESSGFAVTATDTGEDALEIFRNQDFNLIIVDLVLPDMAGCELIESFRTHSSKGIGVRIIAVTGTTDSAQMEQALTSGADDLYLKSVGPHVLRAKFSSLAHKLVAEKREAEEIEAIRQKLDVTANTLAECGAETHARIEELNGLLTNARTAPPVLTDEQIDAIVEKAADKAVEKALNDFYTGVGRGLVSKFLILLGVIFVGFAAGKGWVKL
jgi:DNA-binding response OmpR family regulator